MSKQRLKQNWNRKEEGERLNLWLTLPTYRALKALCERENVTPSVVVEELLLECDLLRKQVGLEPRLGR